MKKTYIIPRTIEVLVDEFEMIATSGGLKNGDTVNKAPIVNDDDDNFFVKGQNNGWDNEW